MINNGRHFTIMNCRPFSDRAAVVEMSRTQQGSNFPVYYSPEAAHHNVTSRSKVMSVLSAFPCYERRAQIVRSPAKPMTSAPEQQPC